MDNDGNTLVTGALYYRTTAPIGMKVWDGAQWIEASAAQQASLVTFEYVATAGQTTFSGADANGVTLSYTVGNALVSVNGVRLRPGDDFTATNGTSVVLVAAAAAGDEVLIDAFRTFEVANTYTQAQVDAALALKQNSLGFTPVNKAGDTMSGDLAFVSSKVIKLKDVSSNTVGGFSRAANWYGNSSDDVLIFAESGKSFEIHTNGQAQKKFGVDLSGRITMPYQPAFSVWGNSFSGIDFLGANVLLNNGSHFNTSNGRFTAPVDGNYLFNFSLTTEDTNSHFIEIAKNGTNLALRQLSYGATWQPGTHQVIVNLSAGDYVTARKRDSSYAVYNAVFSGYLIG